jgi:endogenous inhibitor of DNA gyrase (YacG/DUF329 family)
MISTFTCHHCGKLVPRNPRIKKQKFCSSRACQNTRRYTITKTRVTKSSESRSLRRARNKRWRDNYPAHEYQKHYRRKHPEYVKRNNELQIGRNNKRKPEPSSMIVKTYALSPQPLQDGLYRGFEIKSGKIVKTYALPTQMLVQSTVEAFSLPNTV